MATIVAGVDDGAAPGGPLTMYSSEPWGWGSGRGLFFGGGGEWQFLCGGKGVGYVVIMESDSDKGHNIICGAWTNFH